MPEGPEVTLMVESLKKFIKSKILNIVEKERYENILTLTKVLINKNFISLVII